MRVLLVDDNPDDRALATRVLSRHFTGLRLDEVATAEEFARVLGQLDYDAVITDYQLRWSDGLQVLDAIKARAADMPVVMFTNSGDEEVCAAGMRRGLFDYLLKRPEYYTRLPIAVQAAVEYARARGELGTAQRELAVRVAQLEEAARHKDEFVAMLAHELRNPLAPLRNAVHVLRTGRLQPAAVERMHDMIERQVRHLARLVDDLLDFSQLVPGRMNFRHVPVDLAALVRDVVQDRAPLFAARDIALVPELAEDALELQGDDTRLAQVLDNLLDNALKFNAAGGRVTVRLRREGGEALLEVEDTGAGIEPALLPRLFALFVQGDRSLERGSGGLGIGLAMARRIVEKHGGRIDAHSAGLGQGARFTVRLPLRDAVAGAVTASPGADAGARPRRSVLVIEDNQDAADSMRMLLEAAGHAVELASSGEDGLARALAGSHDLVVSDIGMPGLDGLGVARGIRADARRRRVRLLALTGYGDTRDQQEALAAGFDRCLVKPVEPEALLRAVEE